MFIQQKSFEVILDQAADYADELIRYLKYHLLVLPVLFRTAQRFDIDFTELVLYYEIRRKKKLRSFTPDHGVRLDETKQF